MSIYSSQNCTQASDLGRDDHLIVAARVTQHGTDNASLVPMVEEVERRCGERPQKVTGDSGLCVSALHEMNRRDIDLYVPDNNLRREMQSGEPAHGIGRCTIRDPEHLQPRDNLRSRQGRKMYQRRQAVVEPLFGVLKEQRGMRKFRRRRLTAVTTEWLLAATAYHLTRMAQI